MFAQPMQFIEIVEPKSQNIKESFNNIETTMNNYIILNIKKNYIIR